MIIQAKELFTGRNSEVSLDEALLPESLKSNLSNAELFLAPGMIDLQVNGYMGVDFNSASLSVEEIGSATQELLKDGVTGFLPTLITNDPGIVEKNLGLFKRAMEENALVRDTVMGLHIEGPFISRFEGARGAHPERWIQKPDLNMVNKWQEVSGNNIKLITLSPEYRESIDFIKACKKDGIKLAIGHSNATPGQVQDAVAAGASLSTHLGNGFPRTMHRHNNILFEQIAGDALYASIIADGHHLPLSLIKIILRSKPDRVFLVSDSTMYAGMKPGVYDTFIGGKVELDENKRLFMSDNQDLLAGSGSSLHECVNFLNVSGLCSLAQAWEMASVIPYRYLFNSELANSGLKDRVLFILENDVVKILMTIKNGQLFFRT